MPVFDSADDADDAMVRAAWLYHVDGLTQAEVAARLFVSRPTVGRLLDRARTAGVVRIEVTARHLSSSALARDVASRFALQEAIIVPAPASEMSREQMSDRLAAAAASYLRRHLRPGVVVGVAWGDTVHRTLLHLPESLLEGVTFAAMTGGIDHIMRTMTGHSGLAARVQAIPAPLVVSNPEVAALLREEELVKERLAIASRADVVITSLGAAVQGGSAVTSHLVTDAEVARFAEAGAVADMLGEWIDADGRPMQGLTSDRRIAVDLDALHEVPTVVGIAGGAEKVPGIRAALRARYFDVLVTDEGTAHALLAAHERPRAAVGTQRSQDKEQA